MPAIFRLLPITPRPCDARRLFFHCRDAFSRPIFATARRWLMRRRLPLVVCALNQRRVRCPPTALAPASTAPCERRQADSIGCRHDILLRFYGARCHATSAALFARWRPDGAALARQRRDIARHEPTAHSAQAVSQRGVGDVARCYERRYAQRMLRRKRSAMRRVAKTQTRRAAICAATSARV